MDVDENEIDDRQMNFVVLCRIKLRQITVNPIVFTRIEYRLYATCHFLT